jgi:DNA-binding NtrC family response regulator
MKNQILIIDDELSFITPVSFLLKNDGYDVKSAQNGPAALDIVRHHPIELAVLDLRLGKEDGLDVLPKLKELRPEMSVIVVTAMGTVQAAVEAMRRGADNFIEKPIEPPELLALIAKGLESRQLRYKKTQLERLAQGPQTVMLGDSRAMREVLRLADAVARRETTVLLYGETGTGKGLLARMIHEASPRKKEPFVSLNCAGLQRDLTESELFGHERGAFTGAVERKIGLFEAADGGTLFLDEIGEMDLAVQAKLLKALEDRRFRHVGGVTEIGTDVRLIVATHRDLEQKVAAGHFREDLFYRLNVFTITLPPLRERRDDIAPLALHFLAGFRGAPTATGISAEAEKILLGYEWPGNVRELRNVIERASILCPLCSDLLPEYLPLPGSTRQVPAADAAQPTYTPMTLEAAERRHLEATLKATHWNLHATARDLDISRDTLYRKIEKFKLSAEK